MEKVDILSLVMGLVFGIAVVILSFYGDTVGVVMMGASGITLFIIYLYRKLKYKGKPQKDEMTKRISSIASEFALLVVMITIGVLTIVLHFYPSLFDVFEIMAILLAVMLLSKAAYRLYYKKIKKEIGF